MDLKYRDKSVFYINNIKSNKRGFEFSFGWLFAIIVGAFILVLAIYGVTKIFDTGGDITSARTGKEVGILLNPLETGFETAESILFTMPVETRIYNRCDNESVFGRQIIKISQKRFNKWTETDVDIGFQNKYIFSENFAEGKNFFIFSKPFEFPFKVADLVYLTSINKEYCFADAPDRIKEELEQLNQENLLVENCTEKSINICFAESGSGCDVVVNENLKSVKKNGQEAVYYETDALMYAAIFSDKASYECQLSRLMKRTNALLRLYEEKNFILSRQACSSDVDLLPFKSMINDVQNSEQLERAAAKINEIEVQNDRAECKLW